MERQWAPWGPAHTHRAVQSPGPLPQLQVPPAVKCRHSHHRRPWVCGWPLVRSTHVRRDSEKMEDIQTQTKQHATWEGTAEPTETQRKAGCLQAPEPEAENHTTALCPPLRGQGEARGNVIPTSHLSCSNQATIHAAVGLLSHGDFNTNTLLLVTDHYRI